MSDRITAVGDVIRTNLSNGWDTNTNYTGNVSVIRSAPATFRNLARDEGSLVTNNPAVQNEPVWTSLSVGTYASNIRNGRTGARRLDLPLVSQGAVPVDLIRRPLQNSNENTANALIYNQRFFGMAAVRILLADTVAEIQQLPTVTQGTQPVSLTGGPGVAIFRSRSATMPGHCRPRRARRSAPTTRRVYSPARPAANCMGVCIKAITMSPSSAGSSRSKSSARERRRRTEHGWT